MGKTMIIKGADFYENRIDDATPTPTYRNLINPSECVHKYINSQGDIVNPETDPDNIFAVSGFIPVNGQNINCPTEQTEDTSDSAVFGGYIVYDQNKQKIRFNRRRTTQYIYVEGDAYVRFPLRNDYLNIAIGPKQYVYPAHFAAYGSEQLPYVPYEE